MAHTTSESLALAGQLMMVRLFGTELDADTEAFLRTYRIGGVCLFRQNMTDAAQLTAFTGKVAEAIGPNALIALDQEGGAVVRSTWVPAPPSAMALGASRDAALAHKVGAAVARAVRSLGFNWNFAPVLDLNNNPQNPVIAERSFGADPIQATQLALAWMDGSMAEGVACCVKHFPGHGDTHVDSHRDLPTVDKPVAELERFEFAPFRMAAPTAPAVMTAHIVYPALDPDNPATMSPAILDGVLRTRFGYEGVIITDGMDMHAIAHRYGAGQAAVNALTAGADMVMAIGSRETQLETVHAIAEAIDTGVLPMDAVQAKLARLARLAARFPAKATGYSAAQEQQDRELMARAWRAGLTLRGRPQRPARGSAVRLVARADVVSDGVSEAGVPAATLAKALESLYDVELVTFADADTFDWNSLPPDGRFTILASTSRRRYGQHARENWRPNLHLALWNPYQALDFPTPAVMTYGFAAPAIEAALAWLGGELDASGQCPVPGFQQ